MNMPSCHIFER